MNDTFRSFVAVEIPDEVKSFLASWMEVARREVPGYRFAAPNNLHITLLFLGDVKRSMREPVLSALQAACGEMDRFSISLGDAGSFPPRGRPRILHIGIGQGALRLGDLAGRVRMGLLALGFRDDKPFSAHITLGREKSGSPGSAATGIASLWRRTYSGFLRHHGKTVGPWEVGEVVLMKSILKPHGPTYLVSGKASLAP